MLDRTQTRIRTARLNLDTMPTSPQAVTERYVSNLLRDGQNREFRITYVKFQHFVQEEVHCGGYYNVAIETLDLKPAIGFGPTPQASLRNALTKLGVTFR